MQRIASGLGVIPFVVVGLRTPSLRVRLERLEVSLRSAPWLLQPDLPRGR